MTDRTDTGLSPLTLALCAATVVGALALAPDLGVVAPNEAATSLAAVSADDAAEVAAPDDLEFNVEPQVLGRMLDRDGEIVLGWAQDAVTRGRGAAPSRSGRSAAALVPVPVPVPAAASSDRPSDGSGDATGCGAECGSPAPDGAPDASPDDAEDAEGAEDAEDADVADVANADDGRGPDVDGGTRSDARDDDPAAVTARTTDGDADSAGSAKNEKRDRHDKAKKPKKPKKPKKHDRRQHRGWDDRDA